MQTELQGDTPDRPVAGADNYSPLGLAASVRADDRAAAPPPGGQWPRPGNCHYTPAQSVTARDTSTAAPGVSSPPSGGDSPHPGPDFDSMCPRVSIHSTVPRVQVLGQLAAFTVDAEYAAAEFEHAVRSGRSDVCAGLFLSIRDRLMHRLNHLRLPDELIAALPPVHVGRLADITQSDPSSASRTATCCANDCEGGQPPLGGGQP